MAQRTFSSPLRISAIADISLFLLVLHAAGLLSFHFAVGASRNANSKRIDDGGIKVPSSLPGSARHIVAIRNHPLILQCPIIITEDVRILDMWWMKDGVKLDLYPISTNSGQQQTNSQHQPLQNHQLQTSTQAHDHYNSNNPPSSSSTSTSSTSSSSSSSSTTPPRIAINNDGDLQFEKINHKVISSGQRHRNYSDEGDYRCGVKTPLGVVLSAVITLSVAPATEIRPTQEVKAKSGEPILLECQTALSLSSSSDLRFTWIRGDNVTITQELDARYNLLSSGTLAISEVNRTDAGQYRCVTRDKSSKYERISYVNLVVLPGNDNVSSEPPKILATPTFGDVGRSKTVLILEEDENTILDCVASGIPLPVINWIMTVINDNGTMNVQVSHGSYFRNSINISTTELVQGATGNFTCVAINNAIGEPVTRTIQVYRLPALQREPVSYQYPPAKTVRFECKVQPLFSLVWYKDGQLLETGKGRVQVKGNELVVSNTIRNDSGFYQCEVIANDRVYAIGTARLLINNNREAPDAPTNVECVQTHSTMLTVSWRPPVKLEDIISFSIHYMPSRGEERQKVVPPRTTNINITSLLPHTEYSIYVRSYSTKSASAQSVPVQCTTEEDVPQNKPPRIETERFGPASQVRLTWRPLSNKEARGKIVLYKLQWRSIDGDFSNVRHIDGDSEEFVITDLSADQNYEFRLIPSTSVGWPSKKDSWPWILIPIKDTFPEANLNSTNEGYYYAPPSLHLTVLNSTSVLVNWSEPPRPKEINVKGFRVTYSTKSERVNDVVFFGPITIYDDAARDHLFTNLAPGSTYEFFLQTWGEDWESSMASKFIGTFTDSENGYISDLGENILPAMTGLQVHPISSQEVRLKWEQPTFNSSEGYFYTVKYNKVDSSDVYYMSSTRASVEIKGLAPYTSYEFVVQLTLKDGRVGPFSQKIESRTLPGVPGVPINLHWRVHNQSVIEIEWNAPQNPNGLITKYWVEFKLNNAQPETQNNASRNDSNTNANSASSTTSSDNSKWIVKSTSNTSIFLNEMQRNQNYAVRVKAETKAGVGEPSEIVLVRIFNKKPDQPPPRDEPEVDPPLPITNDQQKLGIMIGLGMSALFISVCITIIACRNRFFPMIARSPPGALYVNGNGHPPRAMRSLESLNCVEMKVLVGGLTGVDGHLDTKGGHPVANGNVPSATDPLLVHVSRNPPGRQEGHHDEETIPNCVH